MESLMPHMIGLNNEMNQVCRDGFKKSRHSWAKSSIFTWWPISAAFKAGRNCVVVRRDVNDAFREISPTKRRVSFCLSAAPFIFSPFSKGLHWLLAAYLCWVLCHYLNNFIAILSASITPGRIQLESNSYH